MVAFVNKNIITAPILQWSVGLCALVTLYLAFCFGSASIYAVATEKNIERWVKHPQDVTPNVINETKQTILEAIDYHSSHPHYYNLLGKTLEWEAYLSTTEDQIGILQQAKKAYLKSASLRQNWPDTWADLLSVETQLQGENINLYFDNANQYGPFIPTVNSKIAQVGLENWQQFTPQRRSIIIEHIARALTHPKSQGEMYRYLQSSGLLKFACAAIIYNPRGYDGKVNLCKKVLK
ncbi:MULTISPECIES: VpsP family polysaccharide biosynthesis protein [Vibrio]|uniref:VpsP family polysaccharide biosynthesis protein n=1 Tax=Vibrio aestuarianus TaxID=28171 RepID=A0ABD7YLP5_9VIBR|nr:MULTISPECIES: VpsP family polysaccharide biosynthesis protein [Vibrio]MDE1219897.1 VpsP family polysaccharide biosynthesis protein [Vibrio aestuarianus]MDE1232643.1 VpsP family polysaccharide biosynthesis protein [Vibrio aestuarianus]MDE1253680.1 VpsP family polysaccharide biosynthesis protein [Vibrio aestuarianus]MDE1349827.1 VpsP family polysaccharide biosynthesis protein [Vibrio aestuarianus]MDF9400684.1 hypothetical protein [Vibrio sp. 1180_3]